MFEKWNMFLILFDLFALLYEDGKYVDLWPQFKTGLEQLEMWNHWRPRDHCTVSRHVYVTESGVFSTSVCVGNWNRYFKVPVSQNCSLNVFTTNVLLHISPICQYWHTQYWHIGEPNSGREAVLLLLYYNHYFFNYATVDVLKPHRLLQKKKKTHMHKKWKRKLKLVLRRKCLQVFPPGWERKKEKKPSR